MPDQAAPRTPSGVPLIASDETLRGFLDEDLGTPWRDVTSDPLFADDVPGRARMVTRVPCVVAGLDEAERLFRLTGATARAACADGTEVAAGTTLLEVAGPVRAILRAERTALNLVARMTAIATTTHRIQRRVSAVSTHCRVAATRKTTPGLRIFEKRAVVHGGGDPHRFGLFDQVLLKDNHHAAAGDLEGAIRRVRTAHPDLPLEVEVETLEDAATAARNGADIILVDNQDPETFARFAAHIRSIAPEIVIEASGGITEETAARYAPHADRISLGALTMAAGAVDIGLDWIDDL